MHIPESTLSKYWSPGPPKHLPSPPHVYSYMFGDREKGPQNLVTGNFGLWRRIDFWIVFYIVRCRLPDCVRCCPVSPPLCTDLQSVIRSIYVFISNYCENFHLTDFRHFYTTKPLWVRRFRLKFKKNRFEYFLNFFSRTFFQARAKNIKW